MHGLFAFEAICKYVHGGGRGTGDCARGVVVVSGAVQAAKTRPGVCGYQEINIHTGVHMWLS